MWETVSPKNFAMLRIGNFQNAMIQKFLSVRSLVSLTGCCVLLNVLGWPSDTLGGKTIGKKIDKARIELIVKSETRKEQIEEWFGTPQDIVTVKKDSRMPRGMHRYEYRFGETVDSQIHIEILLVFFNDADIVVDLYYHTDQQSLTQTLAKTKAALKAESKHVTKFLQYKKEQQWEEALKEIRQEIADPADSTKNYRFNLRVLGLSALGDYVNVYGLRPGLDDEAKQYFDEGLRYAGSDLKNQAKIHYMFGLYFSKSTRNGLAIPYIKKDLAYSQSVNDTFRIIVGYHNLAACFHDRGEPRLRDYYRKKAMDLADSYFALDPKPQPTDAEEWLQYSRILKSYVDDIARQPESAPIIKKLWQEKIKPITKKFVQPTYISFNYVAQRLALAGDIDGAMKIFSEAEAIIAKEKAKSGKILQEMMTRDMVCAHGHLQLLAELHAVAVKSLERCQWLWETGEQAFGVNSQRILGLAYEKAGDWVRAILAYRGSIQGSEQLRESFSVLERGTFFQTSSIRDTYWGLIRASAMLAELTGQENDFFSALEATERIRARQLAELVISQEAGSGTLASLKGLQQRMAPNAVVIDYILTDQSIVILAFDREQFLTKVVPYRRQQFSKQVRTLATALADPQSALEVIDHQFHEISRIILGPLKDMLKDAARVIVLPDGVLNLLPFDLMSVDSTTYHPFIIDKTVHVIPSLRLLRDTEDIRVKGRRAGLFALGDPVYSKSPELGLSDVELEMTTRGHAYLSYFSPLPETRTEVDAIADMFFPEPVTLLIGKQATESSVKAVNFKPFPFIHFATHGIVGGEVPGVGEPALVLGEEAKEDGFLKASEVENLSLNAKVTVLSACKTGSGEFVAGEGVLGMSRAFLVAGSQSVVVSLWSVASKETEALMVMFYQYLREGMDTAQALRQAKLDLMGANAFGSNRVDRGIELRPDQESGVSSSEIPINRHPFFWAPFIAVGGSLSSEEK